jgi:hypothetical protein
MTQTTIIAILVYVVLAIALWRDFHRGKPVPPCELCGWYHDDDESCHRESW